MDSMKVWVFAALSAVLFVSGCSQQPTRSSPTPQERGIDLPAWVEGKDPQYTEQRYLIGVGHGKGLGAAQAAARAELAKRFQVHIVAESTDTTRYERNLVGEESVESRRVAISRNIDSYTDLLLEDVRIAETFVADEQSVYAIAVLNRDHAEARLRKKISASESRMSDAIARASKVNDPLQRFAQIHKTQQAWADRERYISLLEVVRPELYLPPPFPVANIRAVKYRVLEQLPIAVVPAMSTSEGLTQALRAILSDLGYAPVQDGEPHYRMEVLGDWPLSKSDGWHWARGELVITLFDPQGNRRGQHRWLIKEAGTTPGLALDRANGEALARFEQEIGDVLARMGDME